MNRKNGKKQALKNTVMNVIRSFPEITGGLNLSIRGDYSVYVEGCAGIDEFTENLAVFLGRDMKIVVKGEDIELYTFENGCISASGKICNIEIIREENL